MNAVECPREADVMAAVFAGRVGGAASVESEDLQMHLDTCEICRDVVAVAGALRGDRDAAFWDVEVPAAGQVWWRAAIRARLEAAHSAARPLTWAHGVAAACVAGLTAGVVKMAWPTIDSGFAWLGERMSTINPGTLAVADLATVMMQRTFPLALIAACLLLAPLALYFALSDE